MTAPEFKPTIGITNIKSGGLYRGELDSSWNVFAGCQHTW